MTTFQDKVRAWLVECLGQGSADNVKLRCGRFIEEAIELAQAGGLTQKQVEDMVAYIYSRPKGEIVQEVGGVAITLATLCSALNVNLETAGKIELARCWENIDKIRKRNKTKPDFK